MPFHFSTHHQQHIKHGHKRQERGIYQEHYTSMNVTRNPGSSVGKRWPADNYHTKIVLLWLKYYLKGHKILPSIQLNVYDVVTRICSNNYTYCFELSFENLTPPNMQLQFYILSWVIFYQSCCVFSKQNWFKILFSFKVIFFAWPNINRNRNIVIA